MSIPSSARDDPPDLERAEPHTRHKTLLHVIVANKLSRNANAQALVQASASALGAGVPITYSGSARPPKSHRPHQYHFLFSGEINTFLDGMARLDVEQILQGTAVTVILATEPTRTLALTLPLDRGAVPKRLFQGRK